MKKRYFVGDVAELLGVHRNTILGWIRAGKLKKHKVEPERDILSGYYFWYEHGLTKLKRLTGQ